MRLHRFAAGPTRGAWTSPWIEPAQPFLELVPSFAAQLPPQGWLRLEAQVESEEARDPWLPVCDWALADDIVRRTSLDSVGKLARVEVDTVVAQAPLSRFRLRVTAVGEASELSVSAVTSPGRPGVGQTPAGIRRAVELDVPRISQETHVGMHPLWGGGGAGWCSPASTAMVVSHWHRGPVARDLLWVDPACPHPELAHAARYTYDEAYGGCGNWAFNTAYAASFGLEAFVHRLDSFAHAEAYLRAGIPLVLSIRPEPGALEGYRGKADSGHLLVLVGVTAEGRPIVNDPASPDDGSVRRTFPRAELEHAWLVGTGGTVYVIHPRELPAPGVTAA